ncbi:MAG: sulfatase-like hydrolase/transferase [Bacteroidales bacterium]|nr:sulfatase-like hydrolase/transferase [Bacteroidales bacterium]
MERNKILILGVTIGTPLLASGACKSNGDAVKPNILIILLDDAGYNDFGFMGSKDLQTPNIDKLARKGVILTDAHVSASVSGPSRAGILTGRYQQRFGYECNPSEESSGMALSEKTIGDVFSSNGYLTSCVGKWHQGAGDGYRPNRRGFDHFYGFLAGSRSYFYRPNKDDIQGSSQSLQLNGVQKKFDGYLTDVLADGAIRILNESGNKPFMMYLAFNAVHTPMEATQEDLNRFAGHPRQKLAAMTWAVDRAIGKVIDRLEKLGKLDNTLIFFLSDNGGATNNQSSNLPLKGFKGNKFEGGQRVPYFVTWIDHFKGGTTFDGLCSSLDIFATAASAAGIQTSLLKNPLDGVNLLPYLEGKSDENPHSKLFWRKDKMAAARIGDYKLVRVEGVGERLYNLKDDLGETKDLTTIDQDKYNELMGALSSWETQLIRPLWTEGNAWDKVTLEIHRDLMNNEKVRSYSPGQKNK